MEDDSNFFPIMKFIVDHFIEECPDVVNNFFGSKSLLNMKIMKKIDKIKQQLKNKKLSPKKIVKKEKKLRDLFYKLGEEGVNRANSQQLNEIYTFLDELPEKDVFEKEVNKDDTFFTKLLLKENEFLDDDEDNT